MKIDVRGAVMAAKQYFQSLQDMIGQQLQDLRLEEVELSEDKQFWFITLGFDRPANKNSLLKDIVPPNYERVYRIFKIDSESGEVQSMKIREL
ncbi:MAG TPA: hypothetical protein DCL61_32720 [Cyanobacteria bacterium UBA12227]|nr:hypothetical protein [Cyanobacteria bacterium UBA12227]HAX86726.1 hypothetical protein [Cyanobacteria bacterium UBA11370]HBY78211.1 hypothetical protein [Cyanobacteria bacterium UBA11148]